MIALERGPLYRLELIWRVRSVSILLILVLRELVFLSGALKY